MNDFQDAWERLRTQALSLGDASIRDECLRLAEAIHAEVEKRRVLELELKEVLRLRARRRIPRNELHVSYRKGEGRRDRQGHIRVVFDAARTTLRVWNPVRREWAEFSGIHLGEAGRP